MARSNRAPSTPPYPFVFTSSVRMLSRSAMRSRSSSTFLDAASLRLSTDSIATNGLRAVSLRPLTSPRKTAVTASGFSAANLEFTRTALP